MLSARFDERFISALYDALAADIDPRSSRHLAVHGQPFFIEDVKVIPIRPMGHQIGIGN